MKGMSAKRFVKLTARS